MCYVCVCVCVVRNFEVKTMSSCGGHSDLVFKFKIDYEYTVYNECLLSEHQQPFYNLMIVVSSTVLSSDGDTDKYT